MKFKHEKDKEGMLLLHPILLMVFNDMRWYTMLNHHLDLTVTATISTPIEDKQLGRTSLSHQRGLALDIRTSDLPDSVVKDIVRYINHKQSYFKYKYTSRTGARRLAYWHNNSNGDHIHLAIHSQFKDYN